MTRAARRLLAARLPAAAVAVVVVAGAAFSGPPPAAAAVAEEAQRLFDEGNDAYWRGDYAEAARLYGRVLAEHRVEDPVLYHNLGGAYFRTGAYGSAILYYKRGLRLDPSDEVARSLERNLEVARTVLQDRYRAGTDGSQFIYAEPGGLLYRATHVVPSNALTGTLLGLAWVLAGLLVARRLRPGLRGLGAAAVPLAVVTALVALLLWGRVYADDHFRVGVVVQDGVALREGPHPDARGVDLPEGMEVRILEDRPGWTRVELATGREGWLARDAVRPI